MPTGRRASADALQAHLTALRNGLQGTFPAIPVMKAYQRRSINDPDGACGPATIPARNARQFCHRHSHGFESGRLQLARLGRVFF